MCVERVYMPVPIGLTMSQNIYRTDKSSNTHETVELWLKCTNYDLLIIHLLLNVAEKWILQESHTSRSDGATLDGSSTFQIAGAESVEHSSEE